MAKFGDMLIVFLIATYLIFVVPTHNSSVNKREIGNSCEGKSCDDCKSEARIACDLLGCASNKFCVKIGTGGVGTGYACCETPGCGGATESVFGCLLGADIVSECCEMPDFDEDITKVCPEA